jgi:carbon monoxide dehydrogenase subunit G
MQVRLEKRYEISAPPAAAWVLLSNIREVARCMPGAAITEQTGDNQYKGTVSVKVGPMQSAFGGTIHVTELDEQAFSMALSARGRDRTGTSNATMELTASLVAVEGGCELIGHSQVKVMGRMANFGARVINGVADQLIDQFLTNFSRKVIAESGEGAEAAEAAQPGALNPFALLWGMVKSFFGRLFGGSDGKDASGGNGASGDQGKS